MDMRTNTQTTMTCIAVIAMVIMLCIPCYGYSDVVNDLQTLIESNTSLALLLNRSISEVSNEQITQYTDFYSFWDSWLNNGPYHNSTFMMLATQFVMTPSGYELLKMQAVQDWLQEWQSARKAYCDSNASMAVVSDWLDWHQIDMSLYQIPATGFHSFNEFFTRRIKSEYRPISATNDDGIVAAPSDGSVEKIIVNELSDHTRFDIKGDTYDVCTVLGGDTEKCSWFEHGSSIQIFLRAYDYHRYHAAVRGTVLDVQMVHGYQFLQPPFNFWTDAGTLNESYFVWIAANNQRGVCYVNTTDLGVIAHVFIGMDIVNSVNIDVGVGEQVDKGDELGYFKYGGSSVLLLFQSDVLDSVTVNVHDTIRMGQALAMTYAPVKQPEASHWFIFRAHWAVTAIVMSGILCVFGYLLYKRYGLRGAHRSANASYEAVQQTEASDVDDVEHM